ncbi:hypothetical protein CSKR_113977 [Clonorchis sinensis]|uniref:Uncharacterized protein n=1 Tax=Clonorchis sinensis TaxID=79923 RepID=A0A3R7CDE4_CLOSI|nr:hypothetical protein CSKR_113977 [Clonorchis sinensis]
MQIRKDCECNALDGDKLRICFALFHEQKAALVEYYGNSLSAFSCNTLSAPNCHATRRKHEGWDTVRLPKPRQGKSRGRSGVRTTDLPVSKFAL